MGLQWEDLDQRAFVLHSTAFILAIDLVLYPADLLTTRLQADRFMSHDNMSLCAVVGDIVRREGVRGLFRGFWMNTVGSFPGQFIYYIGYEYSHAMIAKYSRNSTGMEIASHAAAGVIAEALSAASYLPTDIVAQRLQTHVAYSFLPRRFQTRTAWGIVRHVWMTEGLKGFFRGYLPYLAVYGPGSAIWWAVYECTKLLWLDSSVTNKMEYVRFDKTKALGYVFSGSVAGMVSCLATNPLDVARTRLQLFEYGDGRERGALKGGFMRLLRETYHKEGIAGLFKGVKPRIWVRAPGSAIALLGYEYLKVVSVKKETADALQGSGSDYDGDDATAAESWACSAGHQQAPLPV